ncbi:MAG: hypothetical protein R2843_01070 [Thermomicrobiales bacterium]
MAGRQQYEAEGGYITRATVWRDGEPKNLPGLLFGDEGAARDYQRRRRHRRWSRHARHAAHNGSMTKPVPPVPDGATGCPVEDHERRHDFRRGRSRIVIGAATSRHLAAMTSSLFPFADEVQGYLSVNGSTAIRIGERDRGGFGRLRIDDLPGQIENDEMTVIAPPSSDVNLALWDVNSSGDAVGYAWPSADSFRQLNRSR